MSARDGVRRAVPLAILMFFFPLDGGRDAFWTFAAYLVLLTPPSAPHPRRPESFLAREGRLTSLLGRLVTHRLSAAPSGRGRRR
jgi:hypothetical protein